MTSLKKCTVDRSFAVLDFYCFSLMAMMDFYKGMQFFIHPFILQDAETASCDEVPSRQNTAPVAVLMA
jgi:hypothetical protein